MKKLIGILLLALPYIAILVYCILIGEVVAFFIAFGAAAAFSLVIALGVRLII